MLMLGLLTRPASAIVGPSEDGSALSRFVVMVLNRAGNVAGFCSGLVVAPDVVLTAAHCVPPGAALKVHFRDSAGEPVLMDVAESVRHPDFHADAVKTRVRSIDLALLHLTKPLPASFQPAAYSDAGPVTPGKPYRVVGFGLAREGDAASSGQLRIAHLAARAPLSSVLLWARDPRGQGSGACTGDSGGPVFAETGETAVALTLWSAGDGKAQCGALTQAVWLAPQRAWIDGILAGWHAR